MSTGRYESVVEFITAAVKQGVDLSTIDGIELPIPPESLSQDEWNERFDEFLKSRHATNPNFDDSRENMYPVR